MITTNGKILRSIEVIEYSGANPKYQSTPTISSVATTETAYTAQTGQTLDYLRITFEPGDDVLGASRLSAGVTDIIRVGPNSPPFIQPIEARGDGTGLEHVYSVGVSALSNPQGHVIGRSAYTFSGITFSSSSGLLGTCSGSVLPATGTAVEIPVSGSYASPTGLTEGTTYYLIRIDDTTTKFATSYANALAGTAIAYTDAGTGTIVITENLLKTTQAAQIRHDFATADKVLAVAIEVFQASSAVLYMTLTGDTNA